MRVKHQEDKHQSQMHHAILNSKACPGGGPWCGEAGRDRWGHQGRLTDTGIATAELSRGQGSHDCIRGLEFGVYREGYYYLVKKSSKEENDLPKAESR